MTLTTRLFGALALAICAALFLPASADVLSVTQAVGTVFLNALKTVAIPLVVVTLISGLAHLERQPGRLGALTALCYVGTTLAAVGLGLLLVQLLAPGLQASLPVGLLPPLPAPVQTAAASAPLQQALTQFVPGNLFAAAASGNLLALIVLALPFALALRQLPEPLRTQQRQFWQGLQEALMTVTQWLLALAPIGVFALVYTSLSETGWAALKPLVWLMLTVALGLLLHAGVTLGLLLRAVARVSPSAHLRAMAPALGMAVTSASSAATLPVTLRCLHQDAGVSSRVTGLTVPLGTTLNMDGTALYEVIAVLFIAQLLGADLSLMDQLLVAALALATTLGMAGIPAASLVALAVILDRVGLPPETLGLLLVTDRPLDMLRTTVNVYSDTVVARVVARYADRHEQ